MALAYVALFLVGCTVSFLVGRFYIPRASFVFVDERFSSTRAIHYRSYLQIKEGLTAAEVEVLLGAPPGWYTQHGMQPIKGPLLNPDIFTSIGVSDYEGKIIKGWADGDLAILVWFDAHGRVTSKKYVNLVRYFN
jgi:hypothetical protein